MSATATYRLTTAEFTRAVAKINQLNQRAVNRGWTGKVTISGERTVVANSGYPLPFPDLPAGTDVVCVDTTIEGEAPCYDGWRFLAAVDSLPTSDGEANWVVRYAPGIAAGRVDRSHLRPGWCDHCKTERANRRHTFIVEHTETAEVRQVGSTCIKDFLGWSTRPVFIAAPELDTDDFGAVNAGADVFTPRTVVALALAATEVMGWVSRSAAGAYGKMSTSDLVQQCLIGRNEAARAAREEVDPHLPAALNQAPTVISRLVEEFEGDTDDYRANLRAVLAAEVIEFRQIALACSAVAAIKHLETAASADTEKPAQPEREWLGQIGDAVEITGTILTAMTVDGYAYGTTQRLIVIDAGPTLAKTYTAASWAYEVGSGDTVTITAQVKQHSMWQEHQQTVIKRPKLIATVAAAADGSDRTATP